MMFTVTVAVAVLVTACSCQRAPFCAAAATSASAHIYLLSNRLGYPLRQAVLAICVVYTAYIRTCMEVVNGSLKYTLYLRSGLHTVRFVHAIRVGKSL